MKQISLTLLKSIWFIRLSVVGCLLFVAMPLFIANAQSTNISFDSFSGCEIMDNGSFCNLDIPQQSIPGYPTSEFTIGGTYQSKNTTGDYLIVKNLNDNFPKVVAGGDNRLNWKAILPADGNLGTFKPRANAQPIVLAHGANTIVFTQPDGTEVSRQVVQATCSPKSEWKANTQSYAETMGIWGQGSCVPTSQTTGAAVSSFTVSDCVIALGDSTCNAKIDVTATAGRQLQVWYTNDDAVQGSFNLPFIAGVTGQDPYNKNPLIGLYLLNNPSDSTNYSFDSSIHRGFAENYNNRIDVNGDRLLYGLNRFTLSEPQGRFSNESIVVGNTSAKATCASGTIWSRIEVTSSTVENPMTFRFACLKPIAGTLSNAKTQNISLADLKAMTLPGYPAGCTSSSRYNFITRDLCSDTTSSNPTTSTTPGKIKASPAGCASALYNSAYALANCPGGVGTIGAPVTTNTTITTSLALGSRGTEVETLQKFLISQNYLASDSVTGYYGPATVAAVQKYQCAKGIVCDGAPDTTGYGAVGPSTRAAINTGSNSTNGTTQANSDISALIQSLLKQVQALMVQLEALKAKGM